MQERLPKLVDQAIGVLAGPAIVLYALALVWGSIELFHDGAWPAGLALAVMAIPEGLIGVAFTLRAIWGIAKR